MPPDESVATPVAPQNENPRTATAATNDCVVGLSQFIDACHSSLVDRIEPVNLEPFMISIVVISRRCVCVTEVT